MTELLPSGEKVLWRAKPTGIPFVISVMSPQLVIFGSVYAGFAIFWMATVSQAGDSFWLFGLPFFFIGFGIIFSPSVKQLLSYRNTKYSITDRRLIIETGAISLDLSQLILNDVNETSIKVGLVDRMFGSGTVYATTASGLTSAIKNVRKPYDVQELLEAAIRNTVVLCDGCRGAIPADAKFSPNCGKKRLRTLNSLP